MKEEHFLIFLNLADDKYILEAMPDSVIAMPLANHRKWLKAAVIAVCVILAAGTVAYATGIISSPFHIYKTSEELSSPDQMTDFADDYKDNSNSIVDNTENSEEKRETINLMLFTEGIDAGAIKGPIKEDALQTIGKQYNESYSPYPPYTGYNHYGRWFDSQKEALDYIGCDYLEEQYYPFDQPEIVVAVEGHFSWMGMPYNLPEKPDAFILDSVRLYIRGKNEGISVNLETIIPQFLEGTQGNIGYFGVQNDGSTSVQIFTTASGCNATKMNPVVGHSSNYYVVGMLSKNYMVYNIRIDCDWEKKTEADQIFNNWVSHF